MDNNCPATSEGIATVSNGIWVDDKLRSPGQQHMFGMRYGGLVYEGDKAPHSFELV